MTIERTCAEHETPLIELTCAYQHGVDRNGDPTYECDHWYLTRAGKVIAECWRDRETRWLRGHLDGTERKLSGRDEDGGGGKPYVLPGDVQLDPDERAAARREVKAAGRLRWKERDRAAREGREPAEWARKWTDVEGQRRSA